MYSAKAIANYFLDKGNKDEIGVTVLKIIKLVYIAHGWYLALTDKPLIQEQTQAWKLGPVIPELYHEFKEFGYYPITRYAYESEFDKVEVKFTPKGDPDIQFDMEEFLDVIWNIYKRYTAIELAAITHRKGTPWHETTKTFKP